MTDGNANNKDGGAEPGSDVEMSADDGKPQVKADDEEEKKFKLFMKKHVSVKETRK